MGTALVADVAFAVVLVDTVGSFAAAMPGYSLLSSCFIDLFMF